MIDLNAKGSKTQGGRKMHKGYGVLSQRGHYRGHGHRFTCEIADTSEYASKEEAIAEAERAYGYLTESEKANAVISAGLFWFPDREEDWDEMDLFEEIEEYIELRGREDE